MFLANFPHFWHFQTHHIQLIEFFSFGYFFGFPVLSLDIESVLELRLTMIVCIDLCLKLSLHVECMMMFISIETDWIRFVVVRCNFSFYDWIVHDAKKSCSRFARTSEFALFSFSRMCIKMHDDVFALHTARFWHARTHITAMSNNYYTTNVTCVYSTPSKANSLWTKSEMNREKTSNGKNNNAETVLWLFW